MKKVMSLLLVLLLCSAMVCPVLAAEDDFMPSSSFGEDGPEEPNVPGEPGEEPGEPGMPGEGGEGGEGGSGDAPYTGDDSRQQMMIWGATMGAALVGIVLLAAILRKRMADSRN